MFTMLQRVTTVMGRTWCQAMHPDPMWPINGSYQCPKCLRRFPVPWEAAEPSGKLEHAQLLTPAEAAKLTTGAVGLTALPPAA